MNANEIGRNSAARALEAAKRCAAVAGLAVVLSPLASLPAVADPLTVDHVSGNGLSITYAVYNSPSSGDYTSGGCVELNECSINGISLPEYHHNDLDFSGSDALPFGWQYSFTSAPLYAGASTTTPELAYDYVNLFTENNDNYNPIGEDATAYFYAAIPGPTVISANFAYQRGDDNIRANDPDIPDTRTAVNPDPNAVPEPTVLASLGIGGLAALLARRRRRKS